MSENAGSQVELVWRNDELTDPPGKRPADFPSDHKMTCTITRIDPPRLLAITWGSTGGVTFQLEPRGDKVMLTLTHRRVTDRSVLLNACAGWHAHLDILAARIGGRKAAPFWDHWARLKQEYAQRLPQ